MQDAAGDAIVQFELGLAMSKVVFDADKQRTFIQGIADAAGVGISKVKISRIMPAARRAGSIRVTVEVAVEISAAASVSSTLTTDNINAQLEQSGLPKAEILSAPVVSIPSQSNVISRLALHIIIGVAALTVLICVCCCVSYFYKSSRKENPATLISSSQSIIVRASLCEVSTNAVSNSATAPVQAEASAGVELESLQLPVSRASAKVLTEDGLSSVFSKLYRFPLPHSSLSPQEWRRG